MTRTGLMVAVAVSALASAGCSQFVSPHHVYAPLLDRGGQLDVGARAGASVPGGVGVSADVAYAPVDHFEIVAGGDFTVGDETSHYGGQLAVGTFVRDDVFRLELLAGAYGGYAEGRATGFSPDGGYRVSGAYAMPYGQVLIGFESGHFELAGGLRAFGSLADITIDPLAGAAPRLVPRDGYERVYIEPVITLRIPFDIVRIDFVTGWPINPRNGGDPSPGDLAPEPDLMWYFAIGVAFQFDTIEQPEPEPEYPPPTYAPAPVYAPAPAPAPPAAYTPPPAPPPPTTPPTTPPPILTPVPPSP